MSESITIPADFNLPNAIPGKTWDELHAWYEANEVHPGLVTASRPIVMTADSIDRWEIVGSTADQQFATVSRRGRYELAEGEEWTHDDDFAIAIHRVVTPIVLPLPEHLRAALAAALA